MVFVLYFAEGVPFGFVYTTLSYYLRSRGVPLEHGRAFALDRAEWIRTHRARLENLRQDHAQRRSGAAGPMDEAQAARRIRERALALANERGFACRRVTIRRQKTRWGSCNLKNDLSLNLKLACLPPELMDYVILHELVHTRIRGHGRDFWEELERCCPGARGLRRRLRDYLPELL